MLPAKVVALKDSLDWLSVFQRVGPEQHYELVSALNYWKEYVIDKLQPEKVFLCANHIHLDEWSTKKADVDKQWTVEVGIFIYKTGLTYDSTCNDFRKCMGYLFDEVVRTKLKSVFGRSIVFYVEVGRLDVRKFFFSLINCTFRKLLKFR